MPQVFHRSANSLSRLVIFGVVFGVAGFIAVGMLFVRSPYATAVGMPVDQPIPFSHKHHVTDDGIDCRYCHTTVENSPFAGMPDTKTCMNCHSQIWNDSAVLAPVRDSFATNQPIQWIRVTTEPDYVYFDHSIHVNKGIGCSSCHGQVDQMPLTYKAEPLRMQECIDCHRNPAQFVRPESEVFNMSWQPPANQAEVGAQLVQAYHIDTKISCSTCHH